MWWGICGRGGGEEVVEDVVEDLGSSRGFVQDCRFAIQLFAEESRLWNWGSMRSAGGVSLKEHFFFCIMFCV